MNTEVKQASTPKRYQAQSLDIYMIRDQKHSAPYRSSSTLCPFGAISSSDFPPPTETKHRGGEMMDSMSDHASN